MKGIEIAELVLLPFEGMPAPVVQMLARELGARCRAALDRARGGRRSRREGT